MSDTTNQHIGNVLANVSDEALKEILQQYAKKCNCGIDIYSDDWKDKTLKRFQEIMNATQFDYEGNIVLSETK